MAGGRFELDNAILICCDVMYRNLKEEDNIVEKPPTGRGATLTIRYKLPR